MTTSQEKLLEASVKAIFSEYRRNGCTPTMVHQARRVALNSAGFDHTTSHEERDTDADTKNDQDKKA